MRMRGLIGRMFACMIFAAVMTVMFVLPVFAGGREGLYIDIEYIDASTQNSRFSINELDPDKELLLDIYIDDGKFASGRQPFRQEAYINEYFGIHGEEEKTIIGDTVMGLSIPVPDGYSYVKRTVYFKPLYAENETETEQPAYVRISDEGSYIDYGRYSLATWNEERGTMDVRFGDAGISNLYEYLRSDDEEEAGSLELIMEVYLLKDGDVPYGSDEYEPPVIEDGRFSSPNDVGDGIFEYEVRMTAGSSYTATDFKKEAGDSSYKIKSSKPSVATMTSKGKITVKKAGCTEIRVIKNNRTFNFVVTGVKPKYEHKKVVVNIDRDGDDTGTANVRFDCNMMEVSYTSSRPDVAEVIDERGNVRGLKRGKSVITANVYGKKYKCVVYVYDPELTGKSEIKVGRKTTLKVKHGRGATTDWASSDEEIATVSRKGVVKGHTAGVVTISCRNNGRVLRKSITINQ